MYINRLRFFLLAILLLIYLIGVLVLSAVTLYEPRNTTGSVKTNGRNAFEYGMPGLVHMPQQMTSRRMRIEWCAPLKFRKQSNDVVALVSFPGSGNTWVRYLLQQATGFYTGSVYKDFGLLKNGFPAENIANSSVLVVKTHEWGDDARKQFTKAILLVRQPRSAIQAEFNRQSGGHIGFASPDRYRRTRGRYWHQFVIEKLDTWKQTNLDWLYNFTGPTHVIFYEQLIEQLENTLMSIFKFLNLKIDQKLFNCAVERREGIYRRKKRVLTFDPYTNDMKRRIDEIERKIYGAIYAYAAPTR